MHALPALTCEAIGAVLALSILAAGRWLTGSSIRPTPLEHDEYRLEHHEDGLEHEEDRNLSY